MAAGDSPPDRGVAAAGVSHAAKFAGYSRRLADPARARRDARLCWRRQRAGSGVIAAPRAPVLLPVCASTHSAQ
jgi:hypothetical protein